MRCSAPFKPKYKMPKGINIEELSQEERDERTVTVMQILEKTTPEDLGKSFRILSFVIKFAPCRRVLLIGGYCARRATGHRLCNAQVAKTGVCGVLGARVSVLGEFICTCAPVLL